MKRGAVRPTLVYKPITLAYKISPAKPAGNLYTTPVTAPWKQVTLDLVGPLPQSTNVATRNAG